MSTRARIQVSLSLMLVFVTAMGLSQPGNAAPITWIGGNVDWNDGVGNNANWSPADEPDSDDEAIFNTPNSVNLGTANTIVALTMSGGIDLNTNDQDLTVNGLVQLVDASTNLFIGGSASLLTAQNVTINSGGTIELRGGVLTMVSPATGLFDINAGGTLSGHGTVNMNDALGVATSLMTNDGTISALSRALIILDPPPVGTLTINAADVDARIDLDGTGENGVVNVFRNQTLDINVTLADIFNGDINLFQNSTLDIAGIWTLGTGTIDVDNGATGVFPAIPAGVAHISGGAFAQNAGTITILDTDGTLQFDAVFTQNGGTLVNNGLVVFNAAADINTANNFTMANASASSMTVNAVVNIGDVTVNAGEDFNWDGAGSATNVTTVNAAGDLNINVENIDLGANDEHNGVITMNSGNIDVQVADNGWVMANTLNINNTASDVPALSGDALQIGNDAGALDSHVNVGGTGVSQISAPITFESDASVNVAAGAILQTSTVTFLSVNAANNAAFTGSGTWRLTGLNTVSETTTINMTGGTVDLDNSAIFALAGNDTNINAPLTVNAATMASYGSSQAFGVSDLTIDNNVGTGLLTVNLDDPNAEWTVLAVGNVNLVNGAAAATLLAGSDINLNGTVNVTGDVRTTARVDIAGTVNINTVGEPLRLAGGTLLDPNTIAGGTLNGPGLLGADAARALQGFGTINNQIDFDGNSELTAAGGTLNFTSFIIDLGTIRTIGPTAVFNFTQPVTTNATDSGILMQDGTIQGAALTVAANSKPLRGFGTVTNVIANEGTIEAFGGVLVVQTAANNNDWDGALNLGRLSADGASATLELRDNALFGFTGAVAANSGGRVFTNGFALDFNPGSTINLTNGTYQSTNSTNIGGTVTVNAGAASTLANNVSQTFEAGSATTLTGNLQLDSPVTTVQVGATFAGAGFLINRPGRTLRLLDGASVGVLIENQGTLELGTSPGQATGLDYQQDATGTLHIEMQGTGLAQFDRLNLTGAAQLNGTLDLALLGGFVPAFGNVFNILSATGGVTGAFSSILQPAGMPPTLYFKTIYNPTIVQLSVVNLVPGDYNRNGVVDAADYALWRNSLGGAVAPFSGADGDGDGTVDTDDYNVWTAHFGQIAGSGVGSGSAVPEPASIALFAVMLIALGAGPGRRRSRASR